ncbi:hypothetical protein BMS3Abin07_00188 [bacterium BMS3Abin07]|nr:hypothetical protein BMS3Abin07_00188 [bacterium BMS3Abin07]GBE33436.1 hypothetical protein BMS3Bbin05_02377 [bacterium BMS3Bbin05]HDO23535.1 hypothetical protein [Nitrospirota bacterium]
MKRIFFIVLIILFLSAGPAFAHGISIELTGNYASEPSGGFGSTFGPGVGVNADFGKIIRVTEGTKFAVISKNIKFRADLSYFNWDRDVFGVNIEYTRIPIFVGARYFFPLESMSRQGLQVFGEGGLEMSFDNVEDVVCISGAGCIKNNDSDINPGIGAGGGIQYSFSDRIYGGIHLRYHVISDSYFTTGLYVGFNLN